MAYTWACHTESSSRYSKDEDHMAQVVELLGDMPKREPLSPDS